MGNRLDLATSPYLLQHADNPVHWQEWSDEAFTEAADRDVPVLLSVGYSACHWCHVMAHESFEDQVTADYLNEHFVNIKVDREERPDVDRIYMDSVQAMTGRGGWPMTVFLDPEGRPFFAGTYFPNVDRQGHPSFRRVLEHIVNVWRNHRDDVDEQARRLTAVVAASIPSSVEVPGGAVADEAVIKILASWDQEYGGFGGAPKFPQAPTLEFLLRSIALNRAGDHRETAIAAVTHTLGAMANGGIHDHLGGGFARYSVDREWLVPHFEKMLYDNALLARLYLRAGQATGVSAFTTVSRSTLDYLMRDMTHPDGGLFSAEDADSEGEEGKFYTWSWDDLSNALGADREWAERIYGASPSGNFEGVNILERYRPLADVAEAVACSVDDVMDAKARIDAALFTTRATRVRPGLDDKILSAWNGLALQAFAEAGAVLEDRRYTDHAVGIAEFVLSQLRRADGRLMRSWRDGRCSVEGFCEDYAAVALGCFSLYQATGEPRWFAAAEELTRDMIELFADTEGDGFFATGKDAEALIARPKNLMDNPTPSDNSLAAEAIQILAAYTGDGALLGRRDGAARAAAPIMAQYPGAAGHMLAVLITGLDGMREVAIVGPDRNDLERVVWSSFRPDVIMASAPETAESPPLLQNRTAAATGPRAFVCRGFVCHLPVETPLSLAQQLED